MTFAFLISANHAGLPRHNTNLNCSSYFLRRVFLLFWIRGNAFSTATVSIVFSDAINVDFAVNPDPFANALFAKVQMAIGHFFVPVKL